MEEVLRHETLLHVEVTGCIPHIVLAYHFYLNISDLSYLIEELIHTFPGSR